jgi:hypothetical protein
MRRDALCLAALAAAMSVFGCNSLPTTCDTDAKDNPPIAYRQGIVHEDVYMTSDWAGELLYFPGGIRYEIFHRLDAQPLWIDSYLSFSRWGTQGSEGGGGDDDNAFNTLAQAAGNQVEIQDVDDQQITLFNDSCAEYWLLVVAGTAPKNHPAP